MQAKSGVGMRRGEAQRKVFGKQAHGAMEHKQPDGVGNS